MTPQEAIDFARHLPTAGTFVQLGIIQDTLTALEESATPKTLRTACETLLMRAEYFRRADVPGHSTWYEPHLRAAAFACERWADRIQRRAQYAEEK